MKIKTLFPILLLWLCGAPAFGQVAMDPYLSALPRGESAKRGDLPPDVLTRTADGGQALHLTLEKGPDYDPAALRALGVRVQTETESMATALVPPGALAELADMKGLTRLYLGPRWEPNLDTAISETKAPPVHAGTALDRPYDGAGVIVGVIDGGFDFTHPAYRKPGSAETRILRCWNQRKTEAFSPPAGYDYGEEYATQEDLMTAGRDVDDMSHGTQTSCCAAGFGGPGFEEFGGVAPGADLVLVSTTFGTAAILDGINYIFDYAKSVGRPAVVNLSIGGRYGPHDGTSPFDLGVADLVEPGYLVVGAAGNAGDKPHHIAYDFESATDTFRTIAESEPHEGGARTGGALYGAVNGDLRARIVVVDSMGETLYAPELFFDARDNVQLQDEAIILDGDTILYDFYALAPRNQRNNRAHIYLFYRTTSEANHHFVLEVLGSPGEFHGWHLLQNFTDTLPTGVRYPEAKAGDLRMTINEVGGTGKRAIVAGAYTTNQTITNLDGDTRTGWKPAEIGESAPFTGRGPLLDGTMKPDLTAPGNVVTAPISSFDSRFDWSFTVKQINEGDNYWRFGAAHGTSFAAPIVAGLVALMLEMHPGLTFEDAQRLLRAAARNDKFTGEIDDESGDPIWGWGKMDAHQTMIDLLNSGLVSVPEARGALESTLVLYPNPARGAATLAGAFGGGGPAAVKVTNAAGRQILAKEIPVGAARASIDLRGVSAGVYFVQVIASNGETAVRKLIVE